MIRPEYDFGEYRERNLLGLERGERPFLYSFWLRRFSRLIEPGDPVCEVGLGLGYLFSRLAKRYKAAGLDTSVVSVAGIRRRGATRVTRASAERIPFKTGAFSLVVAFDVLEHLQVPEALIGEAYRILRPGGHLVLSTPNPESLGARVKNRNDGRGSTPARADREIWFGWRDPTHIQIRKTDAWRAALDAAGYTIVKDGTDMWWDVPYIRGVPVLLQRLLFMPAHWAVGWGLGFLPWRLGENYICIARKRAGR